MSASSIVLCRGFFDPAFRDYYGDVDLSLRCWKYGGQVATCVDSVVEIRGHHHPNTAPQSNDESVFINRWKDDYPAMINEHTSQWNVDKEWSL
jgi:GT2 family glycosyltransferase